jgi:CRP-like cAMP-binding protein
VTVNETEKGSKELTAGSCFGEIAFLNDGVRTATVTAKGEASAWVLDGMSYQIIVLR